jgi:hypothetical protein
MFSLPLPGFTSIFTKASFFKTSSFAHLDSSFGSAANSLASPLDSSFGSAAYSLGSFFLTSFVLGPSILAFSSATYLLDTVTKGFNTLFVIAATYF